MAIRRYPEKVQTELIDTLNSDASTDKINTIDDNVATLLYRILKELNKIETHLSFITSEELSSQDLEV